MRCLGLLLALLFTYSVASAQSTNCYQVGNYMHCDTYPSAGVDAKIPLTGQQFRVPPPRELMQLQLMEQQRQIQQIQIDQMKQEETRRQTEESIKRIEELDRQQQLKNQQLKELGWKE